MATFYVDFVNGSDTNNGLTWGTAIKTIAGVTSAKGLQVGDTVRIAKTPDKFSIGNGSWTKGPIPSASNNILSSTNTSPISITTNGSHGFTSGDVIQIIGHTVNTAANGAWIITVTGTDTFTLDGSTGNGTGANTGSTRNINAKTVKLSSAQTKTVSNCNTVFTAANAATVTLNTSVYKEGSGSCQVVTPAGTTTNRLYAYQSLGSAQDFSSYQELTFWMRTQGATTANNWRICLCSDALGATVVDEFLLPVNAASQQITPLSLTRTGGGNLGSSIQSVAIYTGSSSPGTGATLIVDNIQAAVSGGLNLTCLISPVASNTDPYDNYPIQSINDTLVLIDNQNDTNANQGQGYYGTTQTVTTYGRQPNSDRSLYSGSVASGTPQIVPPLNSTLSGGLITYSGGWNTSTNSQDGMTIILLSGNNARGWTLKSFNAIENIGFRGGQIGWIPASLDFVSGWQLNNCFSVSNSSRALSNAQSIASGFSGIYYPNIVQNSSFNNTNSIIFNTGAGIMQVNNVKCNNNIPSLGLTTGFVINYTGGENSYLNNVESSNNGGNGFLLIGSNGTIKNWTANDNASYAINMQNCTNFYLYNGTANNNLGVVYTEGNQGVNYLINTSASNYTFLNNANFSNAPTVFKNFNGTNINWYDRKGNVTIDTTTKHGNASYSWAVSPNSPLITSSTNPVVLNIAQVYCYANQSTTVKAWFFKQSTSSIFASLVCQGRQIAGVNNDVISNAADVSGWQEVSINFTPTESGVVLIQAYFWWTASGQTSTTYISDLTLPPGINNKNLSYDFIGTPWAQNSVASVAYGTVGL